MNLILVYIVVTILVRTHRAWDSRNQAIVLEHNDSLIVGGKNEVYHLSSLNKTLLFEWTPEDIHSCRIKGKSEDQCQNYIKVLINMANNKLLVCGTNAYNPLCRIYEKGILTNEIQDPIICPQEPLSSNTAIWADGKIYAALYTGFSGNYPLIYRDNVRTPAFEKWYLNKPYFMSSFYDGQYVYFFIQESETCNGEERRISQIVRLCPEDQGIKGIWTEFSKAKFNCLSGEHYWNVLAYTPFLSNDILYGLFTTPIGGSVLCAFKMDNIRKSFVDNCPSNRTTPAWSTTSYPMQSKIIFRDTGKNFTSFVLSFDSNNLTMYFGTKSGEVYRITSTMQTRVKVFNKNERISYLKLHKDRLITLTGTKFKTVILSQFNSYKGVSQSDNLSQTSESDSSHILISAGLIVDMFLFIEIFCLVILILIKIKKNERKIQVGKTDLNELSTETNFGSPGLNPKTISGVELTDHRF